MSRKNTTAESRVQSPPSAVHPYRLQSIQGSRFIKLTNRILSGRVSLVNLRRGASRPAAADL